MQKESNFKQRSVKKTVLGMNGINIEEHPFYVCDADGKVNG
jgi:hypothetical protein